MKSRTVLLGACSLAFASAAHAWFFFMLPLPRSSGYCAGPNVRVGDKIRIPDKGAGIVVSVDGRTTSCKDDRYPVQVALDFAGADAVLPDGDEFTDCIEAGPHRGDTVRVFGHEDAVVKTSILSNGYCTDPKFPMKATLIEPRKHTLRVPSEATPTESPARTSPTSSEPAPVVPTTVGPSSTEATNTSRGNTTVTQRLRELSGMLKEGLITRDDYEAKKREILKAF
jgi:hypothetical protein